MKYTISVERRASSILEIPVEDAEGFKDATAKAMEMAPNLDFNNVGYHISEVRCNDGLSH